VIFSVTNPVEALYQLRHDQLACLLKAGQRLPDAHLVHAISLGSIDATDGNTVGLIVFLQPEKQSELLLSQGHISIVATEGGRAPDGGYFLRLGHPAISQAHGEARMVFTARTTHGYNLYGFGQGRLQRILAAGARCPDGAITFMSGEKAVFDDDGIVVEAACSGHSRRLRITPDRNIAIDSPQPFAAAHPILATAMEPSHSIEGATVSVNRGGQAAYLGSPRSP